MAEPITTQALKDVATEPHIASGDQGSMTNPELRDLIAADKYLRQVAASKKSNRLGLIRGMFMKINPPGTRG